MDAFESTVVRRVSQIRTGVPRSLFLTNAGKRQPWLSLHVSFENSHLRNAVYLMWTLSYERGTHEPLYNTL